MNEPDDDLRALWRARPAPPPIDIEKVRRGAERMAWRVKLRNVAEWAACAFIVPFFALAATRPELPWLSRVASVWISLSGVLVAVWLWRYGRAKALPDPSLDTQGYLRAHRDQLLTQAELLRSTPRWYFFPLGAGILLFYVGFLVEHPETWARLWPSLAFTAALLALLIWANQRGARRLRAQAEALDEDFEADV